ncbi:hypothetical protein MNBD_ALPHA09-1331 [hydrothermal vent metagenome]|uniref:AsmA domain-containing protein n=1 Tax=hydrothermal vent metagenome TaxID=652676 RepID=A0A3B0TA45_9ZZZZ
MRIILGSIFTIFTVVVVAVIAIPFLVSTDWIRDQVVATVNDKTGRTLTIGGRTSLSVFPNLSLTVGQVVFSNPAGRDGNLVRMEELDVGLKLLPLISGGVEVDRLILTRPVFNLSVDGDGRPNWSFADTATTPGGAAATPVTSGQPAPAENGGSTLPTIEAVQLGDVRIVDGTVTYRDLRSGAYQEIKSINATLELPSLADPMILSGTLSWQSEQISFSTEIAEPQALTTGTPTAFAVEFDAPQLKMALSGNLTVRDGFALDGKVQTSTPSVKAMARWLGVGAPDVAGLGPFSLAAGVKADETGIALANAALTLDDMTAEGGLLVGIGGSKPVIRATLAVSRINIGDYIGGAKRGGQGGGQGGNSSGASSPPSGAGAGAGDWSDEPIDMSALGAIDADLRISAAALRLGDIEIGRSALAVTLKDALLSIDLSELQLYDGRAAGRLTINGASATPAIAAAFNIDNVAANPLLAAVAGFDWIATPAIAAAFNIDNVAANPLLAAVAGFDWIEGRAKITGSLASRGVSQRGLVAALNGQTNLLFSDGAVRGVNVAQMARNLQLGNIAGLTGGEAMKTDFSAFSASFNITRGIAQTNDIQLLGPLVRVTGAGVADLPNRTVDFRINPKIVASIEGQGGVGELAGLEVPILVRGPWVKPSVTADVEGLLRDPSRVIDAAKDIGKALERALGDDPKKALKKAIRNPGDFLKQLSGGGLGGAQGGAETGALGIDQGAGAQPSPIGEDIFRQLLGQ